MQNLKLISLAIILFGLILGGCKKEDDNEITIEILSPANNAVIPGENVIVKVRFAATDVLHDIELKLYPKADPTNLIIDIDRHVHVKETELEELVDLSSFPSGTVFVVKAEAEEDEHDGDHNHSDHKVEKTIEFSIQ